MNKEELKQFIVDRRNNGLTFQAICDELKATYGVIRNRQAVQSMYDRYIKSLGTNDNAKMSIKDKRLESISVNLYTRIGEYKAVHEIITQKGYNIPYNKLVDILKENAKTMEEIVDYCVDKVYQCIRTGESYEEVMYVTSYLGYNFKEKYLNDIIKRAYLKEIDKSIEERLIMMIKDTELSNDNTKDVVKSIIERYNIESSFTKLKNMASDFKYSNK